MKGKHKITKSFWCPSCDAELVQCGKKCSNCGNKMKCSKQSKQKQKIYED